MGVLARTKDHRRSSSCPPRRGRYRRRRIFVWDHSWWVALRGSLLRLSSATGTEMVRKRRVH